MVEVLGRVKGVIETLRGADVSLRVAVPWQWLSEGRTIEVELPRNLVCANCAGGGCSVCGNSGAISVRGRGELPEIIQVYLPEQRRAEPSRPVGDGPLSSAAPSPGSGREHEMENGAEGSIAPPPSVRPVTIRIPECGGLPEPGSGAKVRGCLLLHVTIADEPSSNLRLADDEEPLSSSKMLRAEVKPEPEDDQEPKSSLTERRAPQKSVHSARPLSSSSARVAKIPSVRTSVIDSDETNAALPAAKRESRSDEHELEPMPEEDSGAVVKDVQWSAVRTWGLVAFVLGLVLLGFVWLR
ncbi:MAG: hypothetical protein QM784_06120 [Polyangiaceae bacterium]